MPTRMLIDTTNTSAGSSTSSQFRLPLESIGTYSFTIDWGDSNSDTITAYNDAAVTHTYAVSGQYEISITGTLVGFAFQNVGDVLKLLESREFHSGFQLGNSGSYYHGCANHVLFASGLNTSGTTNFDAAWYGNSLTSFPAIDLSNGTSFASAWRGNSLTSFPAIDLSNGTSFYFAWYGNSLTSFPAIDLSNGTNFYFAWRGNSLTSFPAIDLSNGTNFASAWRGNSLTSFPAIDLSNGTNFYSAWRGNSLTSFPAIDLSNGTNFYFAWYGNSLDTEDYSAILAILALKNINTGVSLGGGGSQYANIVKPLRDYLIKDLGWTITDGGEDPTSIAGKSRIISPYLIGDVG